MIEFKNESDNVFVDISSEEYRTYNLGKSEVTIVEPVKLAVTNNGHRIFDASGMSHYIPKGWIHLKWKAKKGEPHFVK